MRERRSYEVSGVVQGVGFRPFVHALATQMQTTIEASGLLTLRLSSCAVGMRIIPCLPRSLGPVQSMRHA